MGTLGECVCFEQSSGRLCWRGTFSNQPAAFLSKVPLRLKSPLWGVSLRSPISSASGKLTALASTNEVIRKSAFVEARLVSGADVSERFRQPRAVVSIGPATQEDRGQEQAVLEVTTTSQNGVAKRNGVPSGFLRLDKDGLQASARTVVELPKSSSKDLAFEAETTAEAPRKRSKSLLDSIRNKVLNTSEEALAKAALKTSPKAKKLVARRLLDRKARESPERKPRALKELPETLTLESETDVLGDLRPLNGSVRQVLGKGVNGHNIAAGCVQNDTETGSVNGALWAVAAVASHIAKGKAVSNGKAVSVSSMGVLNGKSKLEGEGAEEVRIADQEALLNERSAERGRPQETVTRSTVHLGADTEKAPEESGTQRRGRRVKKGAVNATAEERAAAFEEGVMDAVRQAESAQSLIGQANEAAISGQEASFSASEETGLTEEDCRKDSGSSASTSGRESATSGTMKASRVSADTESLIEQALSGDEKPAAPARRARKRVQKVVALEEASGECQKLKRVRKRVRVRSEGAVKEGQEDASALGVDALQVEVESSGETSGHVEESVDEPAEKVKPVRTMIGAVNGAAPPLWKSVGDFDNLKRATQSRDPEAVQLERRASGRLEKSKGQSREGTGPIQALRASAPGLHQGDLVSSRKGLKVASQRGAPAVLQKEGDVGNFDTENGVSEVATTRDLDADISHSMATMKVPIGPIEALRASASRPATQEATAVTVAMEKSASEALWPSAITRGRRETIDYLSDLIDEDVEEETFGLQTSVVPAVKSAVLTRLDRPEKSGKEFRGWGRKQPAQTANYFTNSMLDVHSRTKVLESKADDSSYDFDFDQFDYSVEAPKREEEKSSQVERQSSQVDVHTEGSLGGLHDKQRKRRRGQLAETEPTSSASSRETQSTTAVDQTSTAGSSSQPVFLMRASWRDLSEGRLDPVGYKVVSAKSGALIGTVTALEPLKVEEEKEMEETGLRLHTSVLQVTAVEGFVDEFVADKVEVDLETLMAEEDTESDLQLLMAEEGNESEEESDLEEDGDVLADLNEMKAALGLSEDEAEGKSEAAPRQEFAIPILKEYVADVSQRERRITVSLPGPLHRISRRPAILRGLGMALYRYCSSKSRTVKMLARNKAGRGRGAEHYRSPSGRHISTVHPQVTYMPTEKELLADARDDIIEDIELVGGFAVATHALGLSRQKRPIGFWENKLHLDAEIELFNYSRWVERTDPETGAIYWVNLLNDMVSRTKPPPPDSLTPPLPVSYREEDVGTACMPKRKDVQEAGRWDLHHAIVSHGGYTAVSRDLGRQSPLPRSAAVREQASKYAFPEMLVAAIRKLMKEKSLTKLPSIRDFEKMGRADIVFGFRRHGGLLAVAELMKVEPKHNVQWTLESATAALNEYVEEKAQKTGQERSMPTLKELQQAGKSNLRYVIQHFGQKVMAEQLGLRPNLSTQEKSKLRAQQQSEERRKKTRSRGQPIRTSQEHLARFRT